MRRFAVLIVSIALVAGAIPQSLSTQDHATPDTHDLGAPYLRPSPFLTWEPPIIESGTPGGGGAPARGYPPWLLPAAGAGIGVTAAVVQLATSDADAYPLAYPGTVITFAAAGALTGWIIDWFIQELKKP